jgi:outer membrane protein TolC
MKKQLITLLTILYCISGLAQQRMKLSLDDALRLAQTQSLQSFLVKNTYLAGYWQYKSFQANYLPSLSLNSQLISYSNANQLRYNSITNTEDYVRTQTLNSRASLTMVQNIGVTGGTFYVQSDLDRFENFGETPYNQFSSRPFRIGYHQELFGYNQFKWERKLEPKKYEQAMRQYLHDVEQTNMMSCNYFFSLAMARMDLDMAQFNYANMDTLLQVARKRFELGTIQKEELLELELNLNNASIKLEEARMKNRKNQEAFISFLRLPAGVEIEILLPEAMDLTVPESKALDLAMERNGKMLEQQVMLLNAQSQVAKTRAENRFQANLNVSYGMNKADGYYDHINDEAVNGEIGAVYRSPFDDYQQLGVNLSIPILDWGRRKGQYQMAKSKQEITRISVEQAITAFEQEVITKVLEFNLQYNKVLSAAKSDTLAMSSYELTSNRFRKGNVDVLKLTSSQQSKDNARFQYIQALFQYWSDYYAVRQLTLYDFGANQLLEEDFKKLLESMR